MIEAAVIVWLGWAHWWYETCGGRWGDGWK